MKNHCREEICQLLIPNDLVIHNFQVNLPIIIYNVIYITKYWKEYLPISIENVLEISHV